MGSQPGDWMAEQWAALHRLALLVAAGTPAAAIFAAVTEEVGRLLGADVTVMDRYDHGTVSGIAMWSPSVAKLPPGPRNVPLGGHNVATLVFQTKRPARIDDYDNRATGAAAEGSRYVYRPHFSGFGAFVGVPINVEGNLWGVMIAGSAAGLPADTEDRLGVFTELVGVAIADGQARVELVSNAEEQAALRRVATLVARGAGPEEVFSAVAEESGRLLEGDYTILSRYDHDDSAAIVGQWCRTGPEPPGVVGRRLKLGGRDLTTMVFTRQSPVRMDDYTLASGQPAEYARQAGVSGAVGVPIVVDGRLWGLLTVASARDLPLAPDTETRLAAFTELLATAVANAQARLDVRAFAEEQAALRRVATLVARSAEPEIVFSAVAEEVGRLLGIAFAVVSRYDANDTATVVGAWTEFDPGRPLDIGLRAELGGHNVHTLVHCTGRPARIDDYDLASGPFAESGREWGYQAAVAAPINVDDRLWGVMIAASVTGAQPEGTEQRLVNFTELVATAIANAQARVAVCASRARIVAAADTARRRIERDLHDGAQQRLVSLALHLRETQAMVSAGPEVVEARLDALAGGLIDVLTDLREIARGLHPAGLAQGGIGPALQALAGRSAVAVDLHLEPIGRFPEPVEIAVYYFAAEVLTNAAKHADAQQIDVRASATDTQLLVSIADDGRGGANPELGSGLVGLRDRIEALGGRLTLHSPPGRGTSVKIGLPLAAPAPDGEADSDA